MMKVQRAQKTVRVCTISYICAQNDTTVLHANFFARFSLWTFVWCARTSTEFATRELGHLSRVTNIFRLVESTNPFIRI